MPHPVLQPLSGRHSARSAVDRPRFAGFLASSSLPPRFRAPHMTIPLQSVVKWPGVIGVESCRGTLLHGITPATFVLTTVPQYAKPAATGDLVLGDGTRAVVMRDCRVSRVTGTANSEGQTFTIEILDRRWRWRSTSGGFGAIDGVYNDLDDHGKLVPWTIRSPTELAILCLDAMGERDYTIDMPPGIPRAAGADLDRYLFAGENFTQSAVNPRTVWDRKPPAEALAALCDLYGRRVVLQVATNTVAIVQLGVGNSLPNLPSELIAPSVKLPGIPSVIGVAGNLHFQMRLALEPVGLDWDGRVVPINQLSYAPAAAALAKQLSILTTLGPIDPLPISVTIEISDNISNDGTVFTYLPAGATNALRAQDLANFINNHPLLGGLVHSQALGRSVSVTSKKADFTFNLTGRLIFGVLHKAKNSVEAKVEVLGQDGGRSWRYCPSPTFPSVIPTPRLAYEEARAMAQKCIWRYWRIVLVDPCTGSPPLRVPQFGIIKRRQQIVLEDTKIEQVIPTAGDPTGVQFFPAVNRILGEYYDGYSRSQKPTVRGSVYRLLNPTRLWNGAGPIEFAINQLRTERVPVEFSIDPIRQLVIFDSPVYRRSGNGISAPYLVLETSVMLRDAESNSMVRWVASTGLGGDGPSDWQVRDDIQVGVIGKYNAVNNLTGTTYLDEMDARQRAGWYMTGAALKYQLPASETRQYAGIVPLNLDGRIQQVTWIVSLSGTTTIAGSDGEFSDVLPDYPIRRRAENLPPNVAAILANQSDPTPANSPGKF